MACLSLVLIIIFRIDLESLKVLAKKGTLMLKEREYMYCF